MQMPLVQVTIMTGSHFLRSVDSSRGSSVKIGTIQRRLAWPLRKDDNNNDNNNGGLLQARYSRPFASKGRLEA